MRKAASESKVVFLKLVALQGEQEPSDLRRGVIAGLFGGGGEELVKPLPEDPVVLSLVHFSYLVTLGT